MDSSADMLAGFYLDKLRSISEGVIDKNAVNNALDTLNAEYSYRKTDSEVRIEPG